MIPEGKKKFEVKMHIENGILRRDIFIEDELFDYEVDKVSLAYAKSIGGEYLMKVQKDIEKHFLECLSEVVGRTVTANEVKKASVVGYI